MLETLADFDDDLMELLLEDQEPPADDILRHMQNTLGADQIVPVFMGVAEQEMGVRRRLLEAVGQGDTAAPRRHQQAPWHRSRRSDPIVQIIKTYHLPHAGKLSLARHLVRFEVKDGMTLAKAPSSGDMRLSVASSRCSAPNKSRVGSAVAGEIVGLGRLEEAKTADILHERLRCR